MGDFHPSFGECPRRARRQAAIASTELSPDRPFYLAPVPQLSEHHVRRSRPHHEPPVLPAGESVVVAREGGPSAWPSSSSSWSSSSAPISASSGVARKEA